MGNETLEDRLESLMPEFSVSDKMLVVVVYWPRDGRWQISDIRAEKRKLNVPQRKKSVILLHLVINLTSRRSARYLRKRLD